MESAMKASIVEHPAFSLVVVMAILFILPRFGETPTLVSCALTLTAYVAALPNQFRARNGSLKLACALVAFLWAAATLVILLR
jgi:hypothetical protein